MSDNTDKAAADELGVIFTKDQIIVGGEPITVHEFTFAEGLRASVIAQPIIEALGSASGEAEPHDFDRIIGENADAWLNLIALNIDKPREWIDALPDGDGMALSLAFWGVNAGFFMKRLILAGTIRNAMEVQARAVNLPKETPRT